MLSESSIWGIRCCNIVQRPIIDCKKKKMKKIIIVKGIDTR